jgi:hypothetical protein
MSKYNVGDSITIKSAEEILSNKHNIGNFNKSKMTKYCGKTYRITKIVKLSVNSYYSTDNTEHYVWREEWIADNSSSTSSCRSIW